MVEGQLELVDLLHEPGLLVPVAGQLEHALQVIRPLPVEQFSGRKRRNVLCAGHDVQGLLALTRSRPASNRRLAARRTAATRRLTCFAALLIKEKGRLLRRPYRPLAHLSAPGQAFSAIFSTRNPQAVQASVDGPIFHAMTSTRSAVGLNWPGRNSMGLLPCRLRRGNGVVTAWRGRSWAGCASTSAFLARKGTFSCLYRGYDYQDEVQRHHAAQAPFGRRIGEFDAHLGLRTARFQVKLAGWFRTRPNWLGRPHTYEPCQDADPMPDYQKVLTG